MYNSIVLKTDGTVKVFARDDYQFTLEELYELTSCDTIQILRSSVPGLLLCIDDNGKILDKPINPLGTVLYAPQYDYIVGDVLIGTDFSPNPNDEPDIYALDEDAAARIVEYLKAISQVCGG